MRPHRYTWKPVVALGVTVALGLTLGGCDGTPGGSSGATSGERVTVGGAEALVWGTGDYGVVLVHGAAFDAASWEAQAVDLADAGLAVLAVEETSEGSLVAAADYLEDERDAREVALLGASAGGAAAIEAAGANPGVYDQLVILSPAGGDVTELDGAPTFFIYSQDESLASSVEQQIQESPAADTEVLKVDGSAHSQGIFETGAAEQVTDAILDRLTSPRSG